MENKMTKEMIEKAKAAKSAEEILTLAKEYEIEIPLEEAKAYFEQFHKTGELSDDELGSVAGGGCYAKDGRLVVSIGAHPCNTGFNFDYWKCKCGCINRKYVPNGWVGWMCASCESAIKCGTCKYCTYEKGVWYCNKEEMRA